MWPSGPRTTSIDASYLRTSASTPTSCVSSKSYRLKCYNLAKLVRHIWMDLLTSSSKRRTVLPTETNLFSKNEATPAKVATTHQASSQTEQMVVNRLSRRRLSTSVNTTWAMDHMQSRSYLQFKSKWLLAHDRPFTHGHQSHCLKSFLSALLSLLPCLLLYFNLFYSDLVISAQRIQGPESFIIEIEKSKIDGLLKEFEGDVSFLAQFLRLQDKRMVLINPVSIPTSSTHQRLSFLTISSLFGRNSTKDPSRKRTTTLATRRRTTTPATKRSTRTTKTATARWWRPRRRTTSSKMRINKSKSKS